MEYLLVMALSGSTMTCLYLLVRRLLRERLCAGTYYLLAKAAVLYYLIPLPFLKTWYLDVVPKSIWEQQMEPARIPLILTKHTVLASDDMHVNTYAVIQMAVAIIWLLGACVLLTRRLIVYLRITRRFAGYAETRMTDREKAFVDSLRKEYGVRRRVSFIPARDGDPTFTFGIHRPVIICGKETESREAELLARHEMVHIRRLDVLWKILMEFTTFLHWWNPFMWKLYRDFEVVCECSCDEAVMHAKTEDEVKEYLRLLIEEAREKKPEGVLVRWKSGFGSSTAYIRERMDNLMRKNKWNRLATGVLVATLVFANSMTVFAYRDGFSETLTEDVSQEEIEDALNYDVFEFNSAATETEVSEEFNLNPEIEVLYENQFTDEEGNVYPIYDDESTSTYCNHVYDSGTARYHLPLSGGSCRVDEYYADRCVKCGHVIRGALIATYSYVKCPH